MATIPRLSQEELPPEVAARLRRTHAELDALVTAIGASQAMAVLMMIGRDALDLKPPVRSPL